MATSLVLLNRRIIRATSRLLDDTASTVSPILAERPRLRRLQAISEIAVDIITAFDLH